MGKYNDISIKKLVKGINDVYFIPDIQRPFVWKDNKNEFEDKVCSLFDSILRNYPIGTLLFWKIDKKKSEEDNLNLLKFLNSSDEDKNTELKSLSPDKDYVLVLDGQQRMTIFNLVFSGSFDDTYRKKKRSRNLYFNLLTDLEKNGEMEDNLYEFKFFEETSGEYFLDDKGKIWFKVKDILDLKLISGKKKEIREKFDLDTDTEEILEMNLESLKNSINDDNISYYEIEKDKKDDEALEIFVRVNSQGVVLSYSDLLFSKIIQYWKKDSDDENARDIFYQFLKGDDGKGEIKGINRYGDGFAFDNDFILKTSLVLINKEIRYRIKNFNEENIKLIKDNWEGITESIRKVIEFLPKIGITSKKYLRSLNAIIPVINFIFKNKLYNQDIYESTNHNKDLYEKFIYTVLLNGVFGGQSDQLLKLSRDVINKDASGTFPINSLLKSYEQLNKKIRYGDDLLELLDEIKYNTDKSKIVLKIIYGNLMGDKTQEDHLYPQTKMKKIIKDNKLVDNIANLQALESSNQKKGNKDFDKWLSEISLNVPDFKEKSLIPKLDVEETDPDLKACGQLNSYLPEDFESFLQRRKILIYRKLRNYFNLKSEMEDKND